MMDTKVIIQRSILLYVLLSNMPMQTAVTMTAPTLMGRPKSMRKAIAPPKISAKEVEILANMAEAIMGRLSELGRYRFVASDRQQGVTKGGTCR